MKKKVLLCILLTGFAFFLTSFNFSFGHFEDVDVAEFIKRALLFQTQGYGPSRNWGFPLYEMAAYPLLFYWGITAAKIYSLIFYVFSCLLLFQIIFYWTGDRIKAFLGSACFLVHPLAIISGNSVGGTSQEIFLALCALYGFIIFFRENRYLYLYLTAIFCGFATATRQDYFVLSFSLALTLLFFKKVRPFLLLSFCCVYGVAALAPYLLFYGLDHFENLNIGFLQNETVLRKFFRALLGYLAIVGVPLFLFSAYFFIKERKKIGRHPFPLLFLLALLFYFIRFVANADKLEYVWILFPLFVLLLFTLSFSKKVLFLFVFLTFIPNVLQVHFFTREGITIRFHVGFSPGALMQDRIDRLKVEHVFYGDHHEILRRAAEEKFGCKTFLAYAIPMGKSDACFILPEERLRFLNSDRLGRLVDREEAMQNKIIIFPFPDTRGWRQFFKFVAWRRLTLEDFTLYNNSHDRLL